MLLFSLIERVLFGASVLFFFVRVGGVGLMGLGGVGKGEVGWVVGVRLGYGWGECDMGGMGGNDIGGGVGGGGWGVVRVRVLVGWGEVW